MIFLLIFCRNTVFAGFLALSRAAGFLVIRGTEKDVEFWQSWPDSWLLRILSDKKGSTSNMADDIKSNSSNSPAGDDQIPKTTLIKSMELSPGSFWLSRIVILRAVSFIYGWFNIGGIKTITEAYSSPVHMGEARGGRWLFISPS